MPKWIDVKLAGIYCDFSGPDPGKTLEVFGSFWAITFSDNPFVEKSRDGIFSFPDGPIKITQGQMVPINKTITVSLSTPSVETTPFLGEFLKFGGELVERDDPPDTNDLLGSSFKTISTTDIIQVHEPQMHRLRFEKFKQEIRADFVLTLAGYW